MKRSRRRAAGAPPPVSPVLRVLSFVSFVSLASLASLAGCADEGPNSQLVRRVEAPAPAAETDASAGRAGGNAAPAGDPASQAAGDNTFNHPSQQPSGENGVTDPSEARAVAQQLGGAEVAARLHGCTKITYGALAELLRSRGVNVPDQADGNQRDLAGSIYRNGRAALGVANYGARVPEALFASTSAMAKQFDIFLAASEEIIANYANAPGCTGSTLIVDNQFTKEGISCILGKPARDDHVVLANNLVAQAPDPATGQRLAVGALLEAAHTCE